jgi:xylulokinase
MGVMLSAAGSLQWYRDTVAPGEEFGTLCAAAATAPLGAEGLTFLPYLTGERTPLCDPLARGGFIGLTRMHRREHLTRAVLEGISLGLSDSLRLIRASGTVVREATVTGGGTRSPEWMQILADACDVRVILRAGAEAGPALGAARLALIGCLTVDRDDACSPGPIQRTFTPDRKAVTAYRDVGERFRSLYPALAPAFHAL